MSSTGETLKEQAAHAAEPAKEKARQFAEEQKAAGADRINAVAQAVHEAADKLEGNLPPRAAGYIHQAAGGLERASSAIRDRSLDDMLQMVSNFAREQPAAFFGGAVLAGFALSRFLKSSADTGRRTAPESTAGSYYDPGAVGGTAYGIPQSGTSTGGMNPGMGGPSMPE